PSAGQHVAKIARLLGADVYTDGAGSIQVRRPQSGPARHQLRWGVDLLDVDVASTTAAVDSIEVWGEGSAGTDGADKEHWLATDLAGVRGQATLDGDGQGATVTTGSTGERLARIVDGAIRSVDAAEEVAAAVMQARALRPFTGTVSVFGVVDIEIGDWVDLVDLPVFARPTTDTTLSVRVRRLWHHLSPFQGLRTRLGF
nr:hypothetical protein [Deltaproteobacteria bacterium]